MVLGYLGGEGMDFPRHFLIYVVPKGGGWRGLGLVRGCNTV